MSSQLPKGYLNLAILACAATVSLFSLWAASHSANNWQMFGWAIVFSFSNNTLFSLVHESVHRLFSRTRWINELGGQMAALFFPTGLGFQRVCHLGHHLRNRTDHEIFDMYYPDDNRLLKRAQFYCILLGPYFCSVPLGASIYLLFPGFYKIFKKIDGLDKSTDAAMLVPFINHPKEFRFRLEILSTVAFQAAMFLLLDLSWGPYLICYYLFALNWSSLQYADHFCSPRDIRAGAWNLKVGKYTRYIFLNYHLHQAHHQHPGTPWIHLGQHVRPEDPNPSFLKIYLEMWKGPRPVDAPSPQFIDEEMKRVIQAQN